MDGTIIKSELYGVHALGSALDKYFQRRGLTPPPYTNEELMKGIGAPSYEFYVSLLPNEYKKDWEEYRDLVASEEKKYMFSHIILYPGVENTLEELSIRGYRLFLLSNCDRPYMNSVLKSQDLSSYFYQTFCIGDKAQATKTSLMKEICDNNEGKCLAIGDRYYDLEAAQANKLPLIGVLYGYGSLQELAEAEILINDNKELLDYLP